MPCVAQKMLGFEEMGFKGSERNREPASDGGDLPIQADNAIPVSGGRVERFDRSLYRATRHGLPLKYSGQSDSSLPACEQLRLCRIIIFNNFKIIGMFMNSNDLFECRELIERAVKILQVECSPLECSPNAKPHVMVLDTAISLLQEAKALVIPF